MKYELRNDGPRLRMRNRRRGRPVLADVPLTTVMPAIQKENKADREHEEHPRILKSQSAFN